MNTNILQHLTEKYPNVYYKGIRCGAYFPDEWLPIIEELSSKISNELISSDIKEFSVDQIKEKFGGLRYYVTGSNEKIDQFIVEAENRVYELEQKLKHDKGDPR